MILRSDSSRHEESSASVLFAQDAPQDRIFDLISRGPRKIDDLKFIDSNLVSQEKQEEVLEDFTNVEIDSAEIKRAAAEEVARAEGYEEARREFAGELALRLDEERQRIDYVRLEFARDRQRFFAAAEGQVVQLALAVARKILVRDADMEGLPLRSTVKAALARVQDGSESILRVPIEDQDAWLEMFPQGKAGSSTSGAVTVVCDATIQPGDCVLETNVGRVELGAAVQMEEVERGFRELMQKQGGE